MNPPFRSSNHCDLTEGDSTQIGHDFMCLGTQNLEYHHENPADSRRHAPGFHEFQLFPHDDTPSWMYGNSWQQSRDQIMEPVEFLLPQARGNSSNILANSLNAGRQLTLEVCSTASSSVSQHLEFSVQGQASGSCSTTDATQGGETKNLNESSWSAAEREARVERYREKRKKRQFAKKIRYASRKAYAEKRPRVKGRFVKSTEAEPTPHYPIDWWNHP